MDWKYEKEKRELSTEIEQYKLHTKREIENNKKCSPEKIRHNSQNYLQTCLNRYKIFTGEDYTK